MPSSRGLETHGSSDLCLLCLLHWQVGSLPLMPPGKPIRELHFSSKNASFTLINYSSQATFFNSVLTKKEKCGPF